LQQQIETLTREKVYKKLYLFVIIFLSLYFERSLFLKKNLVSQLEIEKLKTENDAKKFQTLLNEYTKERVIFVLLYCKSLGLTKFRI